jgi:hypothetical protein
MAIRALIDRNSFGSHARLYTIHAKAHYLS